MFQNYNLIKQRIQLQTTQVQFIQKFLYPHEIKVIEELIKPYEYKEGSISGDNSANSLNIRQSKIKWIEWNDQNWWIYTKIAQKVYELNSMIWDFDLFGINEYLQYTEYDGTQSNRGHFDWHLDLGNHGIESSRKLTMEIVLNNDYSGGDLSMLLGPSENRFRLQEGDAVIYPSFLLNKIYPVVTGVRKSIVCWASGPSFK